MPYNFAAERFHTKKLCSRENTLLEEKMSAYAVHLRLIIIGKFVVDFLLVIIELFSLVLRAEPLRANID